MRFLHGCPVVLVFVAVCCGNTWGQSDYARELYGNGVHAFNAGRLSEARQHLEASIGRGSHDPRAYYFLGLTKLRSGDTLGAESDFSDAATYEFQGRGSYDVGMALARVQGKSRMRLEKVRRETKMAIRSRTLPARPTEPAPRIAPSPYDDAPSIIEPPMDLPADDLGDPFSDDPEATDFGDDAEDPFGGDVDLEDDPFAPEASAAPDASEASNDAPGGAASAALRALFNAGRKAVPVPSLPTIPGQAPGPGGPPVAAPPAGTDMTDDAADPFGAGEDDPFAEDEEAEADPPAAQPALAADDADDPFGADADDPFAEEGDDPFAEDEEPEAGPAAAQPAPAADDADDPFGADADDPFAEEGDDPFATDEEMDAEAVPAAADEPAPATDDADDPFGGEDPFAEDEG